MHTATIIVVCIAAPLAAICGWLLASPHAPIDLPYDYVDDDPHLIESGRHVRETKAEIRARHEAEREAMVA